MNRSCTTHCHIPITNIWETQFIAITYSFSGVVNKILTYEMGMREGSHQAVLWSLLVDIVAFIEFGTVRIMLAQLNSRNPQFLKFQKCTFVKIATNYFL